MSDKSAAVSLAHRRAGRAVLVSLTLFGVFGAQGLRAAAADAGPDIRLAMKLEIEQSPDHKTASSPTLLVASGKTGKIILGGTPEHPTPDQVVVEVTPRLLDQGRIEVAFVIVNGQAKPITPRLITEGGTQASIVIGRSADQAGVKIEVTPTVVKPV